MIDKILENWLTSAGEREYQIPFCNALYKDGYAIIHSTNHNAMEMGKDIIAQDPSGQIFAYQLKALKGEMLTLSKYRADVQSQIYDLVLGKVVHPAIPDGKSLHKAYLVVNGDIHEHVQRSIDDFNREQRAKGQPELGVIVKGQLLQLFTSLIPNFAPEDPVAAHQYLKLFVSDGRSNLPIEELCQLFDLCAPSSSVPSVSKLNEACGSLAVVCASSLSKYAKAENHVSISTGWTAYCAHILHLCHSVGADVRSIHPYLAAARGMIIDALTRLLHEIQTRPNLYEGDPLIDCLFTRIRVTELVSQLAILYFLENQNDGFRSVYQEFCLKFISEKLPEVMIYGESVAIGLLPVYWLLIREKLEKEAFTLLQVIVGSIIKSNHPKSDGGIATPFYGTDALIPYLIGTATRPLNDNFKGASFALEGLVGLLASAGHRAYLEKFWSLITEIYFRSTEVSSADTFRWRVETGENLTRAPNLTQSFAALLSLTSQRADEYAVDGLTNDPQFAMAFIKAFPHRYGPQLSACLDRWIRTP